MEKTHSKIVIAMLLTASLVTAKEAGYVYYKFKYEEDKTRVVEVPSGIGPQVTMCWESNEPTLVGPNGSTYDFGAIRTAVANIVRSEWQKYSKIHFLWKTSHSDLECDVKINFYSSDDELGAVEGRGGWLSHDLYLNIDWMVPKNESAWKTAKATPRVWWNATSTSMEKRKSTQLALLQEIALHELGHILGFAHEHLRIPEGREKYPVDAANSWNGDREIGAYDKFSIMNYFRLHSPDTPNPNPKLSCGDVASARVLYGPSSQYPDIAPNCYEKKISEAPLGGMTEQQFTNWVGDANLNTTSKTIGLSEFPKIYSTGYIYPVSKAFVENISVNVVPSSTSTGYIAKFGLKDVNFPGVSCEMPVNIRDIKLHTIEKSWGHGNFWNTDTKCQGYDDCLDLSVEPFKLSACSPTATIFIPGGKGEKSGATGFKYTDCKWSDESLAWWLAEKISFGGAQNGTYTCVERNGMFSDASFAVDGWTRGAFELPFNLDRAMGFYPLVEESPVQAKVLLKLDSGELKQPYWVDQFEVTQGSYYAVTGKLPSAYIGIASRPVEMVTWFDAVQYCNKRSIKEGLVPVYSYSGEQFDAVTGACIGLTNLTYDIRRNGYRLMTSKEWKQANRAGSSQNCYWGNEVTSEVNDYSWYSGNSNNVSHPVGQKKPNRWGLYDMNGNVEEWVWDRSYLQDERWTMGGAFFNPAERMCGYSAGGNKYTVAKNHIGFRVMRAAMDPTPLRILLLD